MNFNEYHSHKWSKNLAEVKQNYNQAAALFAQGQIDQAKKKLNYIYAGKFDDPNKVFPGLKVMAIFWKAEEEMMQCRFDHMAKSAAHLQITNNPDFTRNLKEIWAKYTADIAALVKQHGLLPDKMASAAINMFPPQLGQDWAQIFQALVKESETAAAAGKMDSALLDRWMDFCLRGILAYNFGLARQAVLAGMIINKTSEKELMSIVANSKDEYAWELSKKFFVEVFPTAGITDMTDLQTIGRYGMFADQDLITKEILPAPDKTKTEPKIKTSEFLNCQEFSMFDFAFKHLKVKSEKIGIAMCPYCEEHGKKNASLFVPPSMKPMVQLLTSMGYNNKSCVFETKLHPADDMERFMQAQEKVFGGQF